MLDDKLLLMTQLSRTLFQDNRQKTLAFLNETVTKSFELIICYSRSEKVSELLMCKNLVSDLKKSKVGLTNLKDTYKLDIKFCCDIDTLIQMIDAKLDELDIEVDDNIEQVALTINEVNEKLKDERNKKNNKKNNKKESKKDK